jgi:hypothetical protein
MIEAHDGSPPIGELGRLLSMPRTRLTIGTGIISASRIPVLEFNLKCSFAEHVIGGPGGLRHCGREL